MLDTDKLIEMAHDNIWHKQLVLQNCLLLSDYFMRNGKVRLGIDLLRRGVEHDNSKFDTEEFVSLSRILTKDRRGFKDASVALTDEQIHAIECHWKKNTHHPEYYADHNDMSYLDILEMVCDWYARSKQYKTDFIPFVEERQRNRFKFSDETFDTILKTCRLLEELDNKAESTNIVEGQSQS